MIIDEFRGEYDFLSNFYSCPVTYNGESYLNSEAAFQAQKTQDPEIHHAMSTMSAGQAKKFGRSLKDPKWFDKSVRIMYEVLTAKFTQHVDLRKKLIATGDARLVEGNNWNDTFWGMCHGKGENVLGCLLMMVREDLK